MPDVRVGGSLVRYKVYPEKKRKAKIKFCIGFDPENPTPEREWQQIRSDGDAEDAIRAEISSTRQGSSTDDVHRTGDGMPGSAAGAQIGSSSAGYAEPATQMEISEDEEQASERLGPSVPFNLNLCLGGCGDADCDTTPALRAADGFYCEACVVDPGLEAKVKAAAEAELAARAAGAEQPRPNPPRPDPPEPRRSTRVPTAPRLPVYDASGTWSEYEKQRVDSRHDRVRAETYPEVQSERDRLRDLLAVAQREHAELSAQLKGFYGRVRELVEPGTPTVADATDDDMHAAAAVCLQEALVELMQDWEQKGGGSAAGARPDFAGTEAGASRCELCMRAGRSGTSRARTGSCRSSARHPSQRRIRCAHR